MKPKGLLSCQVFSNPSFNPKTVLIPCSSEDWPSQFTCVTVRARPAFQTCLVAIVVTGVVAKELISWAAELVAAEAVVVVVTADPDLVLKLGYGAVVSQLLPLVTGVDHA